MSTKTTASLSAEARLAWSEQKKNAYLVLATLLAMTAFQMGVSPPGGLWSEDGAMIKAIFDKSNEKPVDVRRAYDEMNKDFAAAGSPIMARNCKDTFFAFNVLNHAILTTSLLATGILLSKAGAHTFYVRHTVPACLIFSTVATGINYILVTSCLNDLLIIRIPDWAVTPFTVFVTVGAIFFLLWAIHQCMNRDQQDQRRDTDTDTDTDAVKGEPEAVVVAAVHGNAFQSGWRND